MPMTRVPVVLAERLALPLWRAAGSRFAQLLGSGTNCATGSSLLPAVAVAVRHERRLEFRRQIDIFRCAFPADIHQRFFMMLFRDQHVERRNNKEREDRPDSHPTDEDETD